MLSKLICAVALTASGSMGHTLHKRDAGYVKVNRDGAGGHGHSSAPSSGGSQYGAPAAPSYSAPSPSPSYSAPAPSYSAPEPSYSAPSPSYGSPEPSYGAPVTGYEEPAGLDLTSILIPLLALIGLSLLFPTYVSLTSVKRKRRDAEDEEGESQQQTLLTLLYLFLQQQQSSIKSLSHILNTHCTTKSFFLFYTKNT